MLPKSVYNTIYPEFANQTHYWCHGDSEERYQENLKNNYNLLEKHDWVNKTIEYKYNNLTFRGDDFDDQPCAVFLGCSYTFGVGIPIENTFAYIVAKQLNLKCINLGISGSTNDSAYRFGSYYIPKLNTKLVVFNVVQSSRLEIISNDETFHFLAPSSIYPQETFYKEWISGESNMYFNMKKNIEALNLICNNNNIKFVHLDSTEMLTSLDSPADLARDLNHPGIECNIFHANKILNLI